MSMTGFFVDGMSGMTFNSPLIKALISGRDKLWFRWNWFFFILPDETALHIRQNRSVYSFGRALRNKPDRYLRRFIPFMPAGKRDG